MIFPYGDDQVQGGAKPYFSYGLIVVNVVIFLFQLTLSLEPCQRFVYTFGSIPTEILQGEDLFTLITSMFLHGGVMHLVGNMLYLWVFADNIESVIGNAKFVLFYVLGGLGATFAHIFFNLDSSIPSIGASGAISAVMGAYVVMFPKSKIKLIFILWFKKFHLAALYFLGIWIGMQFISGVMALGPETAQTSGTAWWAHIGGFIIGLIGGYFFREEAQQAVLGPSDPDKGFL